MIDPCLKYSAHAKGEGICIAGQILHIQNETPKDFTLFTECYWR